MYFRNIINNNEHWTYIYPNMYDSMNYNIYIIQYIHMDTAPQKIANIFTLRFCWWSAVSKNPSITHAYIWSKLMELLMTAIIPFSISLFFFVRFAFAILYPLLLFAIISPLLSIGKRILLENLASCIQTLPLSQAKQRKKM